MEKVGADEAMAALDRKHAAAAEAMTEAEGKYAELVARPRIPSCSRRT